MFGARPHNVEGAWPHHSTLATTALRRIGDSQIITANVHAASRGVRCRRRCDRVRPRPLPYDLQRARQSPAPPSLRAKLGRVRVT